MVADSVFKYYFSYSYLSKQQTTVQSIFNQTISCNRLLPFFSRFQVTIDYSLLSLLLLSFFVFLIIVEANNNNILTGAVQKKSL